MGKDKPIKIEAYRCPKCNENLCDVSYMHARKHVEYPILKIPQGVIIKIEKYIDRGENIILPSPTYCIPISSKIVHSKILKDHSVEQGCMFIETRYSELDSPPHYFLDSCYKSNRFHRLNSKKIIKRLQEKTETENDYKHSLLTEEGFNNLLSSFSQTASGFTSLYEKILNLSGLKTLKRTTLGLEKLINPKK